MERSVLPFSVANRLSLWNQSGSTGPQSQQSELTLTLLLSSPCSFQGSLNLVSISSSGTGIIIVVISSWALVKMKGDCVVKCSGCYCWHSPAHHDLLVPPSHSFLPLGL